MSSNSAQPTLWSLAAGEQREVVGFDDALSEAYRIRLMEFGFHPGERVACLLIPGFGAPRVYRVSNTVFSLDAEIAERVFVSDLTSDSVVEVGAA